MRAWLAFVCVGLVGYASLDGDLKPAGKLKIEGKTEYDSYKLVRLKASGMPEGALLRWRVTPEAAVDYAPTPRDQLVFVAPPGSYDVELTVVKSSQSEPIFDEARVKVTIGYGRGGYGQQGVK
jgi:hypothetical protein